MPSSAGAIRAGRAYVEAFMDSTQLEKSLNSVRGKLKAFSRQVGAIGGALAGMGAAILLPMAAAIKSFAAAGDELHKMSKRTGVAVETLSAMDFAASQSGLSLKELEGGLRGMARFSTNLKDGLASATDTLESLGIRSKDLLRLDPEARFLAFADAISKIEDPTQKAGLAMRIFGKSGTALLPLFEQGSAGIKQLTDRAHELGIVFTDDDTKAAAEMTDAMDELMRSIKFLTVTVARELLPEALNFSKFITETIPQIRDWLEENGDMIVSLAKMAAGLAVAGVGLIALAGAINVVSTVSGAASAGVKLLSANLATLGPLIGAAFAVGAIILLAREVYNANEAVKELNRSLEKGKALNDALRDREGGKRKETLSQASQLQGDERQQFLGENLGQAEKNLEGMRASLKGQLELTKKLEPSWLSLKQSGRAVFMEEKANLEQLLERFKDQKRFVAELRKLQTQQQSELEQNAGRTDSEMQGIEKILGNLNEQLETFGLDAGQKAVRELEKLNANETELATAREKLAELTSKQAEAEAAKAKEQELKQAEDEAKRASESINSMLQALADEVSDLALAPGDRERAQKMRELTRLSASDEQLKQLDELLAQKAGLADLTGDKASPQESFSAQGGTFSSLASLAFGSGSSDPLKNISTSSQETAENTRKIARQGNSQTFGT